MKIELSKLRQLIQETMENVHSKHEKTTAGSVVLRKMHDAPGVLESLSQIDNPRELAHVIEGIIDAVPVVRRADVLEALAKVKHHEREERRR